LAVVFATTAPGPQAAIAVRFVDDNPTGKMVSVVFDRPILVKYRKHCKFYMIMAAAALAFVMTNLGDTC
jgi:hypothetical protein